MRIGGLFFGYGGLDMAVSSVFGGELAWVSEIDPGACKVIDHRYPGVPNLGDVTAIDWAAVPRVDIMTGGSPCGDVSQAGRLAGMRDGTRSGLWASMRDGIAVLRPSLVIWENVRGVFSAEADSDLEHCPGCMGDTRHGHVLRALGRVLGDLSDLGYNARWCGLRAADMGAPHGRFRVFLAAYPIGTYWDSAPADPRGEHGDERRLPAPGQAAGGRPFGEPPGRGGAFDAHGQLRRLRRDGGAVGTRDTAGASAPRTGTLNPAFSEWMMGLPDGWVTGVPGITRAEALKAIGNGVVPQQGAAALRRMFPWLLESSNESEVYV